MVAPPFAALLTPLGVAPHRIAPPKSFTHHKIDKERVPDPRRDMIFSEYMKVASNPNHSIIAAVPTVQALHKTHTFLQSRPMRILRKRGDIKMGCAKLALRLDIEWPEWAISRTNVFGLLLSPIFQEFYYYLDNQPTNATNNPLYILFEKCLMREAESRHDSQWWSTKRLPLPEWCEKDTEGGTTVYVGHPFYVPKGVSVSWRRFHLEATARRRIKQQDTAATGYVYV